MTPSHRFVEQFDARPVTTATGSVVMATDADDGGPELVMTKRAASGPSAALRRSAADLVVRRIASPGRGTAIVSIVRKHNDAPLLPTIVYVHGGGFVSGTPLDLDSVVVDMALSGALVMSIDYRLAPEHPYPHGLHDCVDAWRGIVAAPERHRIDLSRTVLVGASAGGGLAAGMVAKLRDMGLRLPVAQVLFAPMLDDHTASGPPGTEARVLTWDVRSNRIAWASYLGGADPSADRTYAVPARQDVSGLPETYIDVGCDDLFHDEDVAYASRIRASGCAVELHTWSEAPHGFTELLPHSSAAVRAHAARRAFLQRVLRIRGE